MTENFADRLNLLLRNLHLLKSEAARKIGVSDATMSLLCSGKTRPSDNIIKKFCDTFDVSEDWLRTGEGEMFYAPASKKDLNEALRKLSSGRDEFKNNFIIALSKMSEPEWQILKNICRTVTENISD